MRRAALATCALAAALGAQTEDYGRGYSFAERAPRTRVERTTGDQTDLAARLASIKAYATGGIVSARGPIRSLDLIPLQG